MPRVFRSYLEAHVAMNLAGSDNDEIIGDEQGISSLKLTDHPDSYNRVTSLGRIISCIGVGRCKSPGHPRGNQMEHAQTPFIVTWHHSLRFPVLNKKENGAVLLLGYYYITGMRKRMGNEGFSYFEFVLRRDAALSADPFAWPVHQETDPPGHSYE